MQLYSIEHMPRDIPVWDLIVNDLGRPPPERIARALAVSRSTVFRWQAAHSAPRAACIALFWLTRWGRSAVDAQATRDAQLAVSYARSLAEERLQLIAQVRQLEETNARLALAVATSGALSVPLAARGSVATADRFHTGTAAAVHPLEPGSTGLAWPALEVPLPALPPLPAPAPEPDAAHPGSHAAPRPTDRSATGRALQRTRPPLPSTPEGV